MYIKEAKGFCVQYNCMLKKNDTDPVNITGMLVHARPDQAGAVRSQLEAMPGVEVHAMTPEGRLVVTIEKADDREMAETFERFAQIPQIVSTMLVYHHYDECGPESQSIE